MEQCGLALYYSSLITTNAIATGGSSTIVGSQLAAVEGGTYDLSSGSFSFTVSGPPGNYGVWVSPSFTGPYIWLPPNIMFTSSGSGSSKTVEDPNAGSHISGFYYLGPPGP